MQVSTNRSVVIISGLLTLLVLSGGTLALGFHNGWLRAGPGAAMPEAVSTASPSSDARNGGAALTEGKPLPAGERSTARDGDDDGREQRTRGHDSDDH